MNSALAGPSKNFLTYWNLIELYTGMDVLNKCRTLFNNFLQIKNFWGVTIDCRGIFYCLLIMKLVFHLTPNTPYILHPEVTQTIYQKMSQRIPYLSSSFKSRTVLSLTSRTLRLCHYGASPLLPGQPLAEEYPNKRKVNGRARRKPRNKMFDC